MNARLAEYLQLVTSHQAVIYGYIRSLAPGANVEDILQETNLVLWQRVDSFTPGTHFKAFALRIAHFKTLEALRRERRQHWLIFDSDLLETIANHQIQEESGGVDSQAALRQCITELGENDRELLHRRYTLRENVREIANLMHRSEGSLQQLFFRLRNQLRVCIEHRMAKLGGDT